MRVYNNDTLTGYITERTDNNMAKDMSAKKTTHRSEEDKRALRNRLSRIEGQIRGIKKMIDNDAYCPDILIQSTAAASALNSFNRELLAKHINGCMAKEFSGESAEMLGELVSSLQAMLK